MPTYSIPARIALTVVPLLLAAGCGRNSLDYETAMNLLRDKSSGPVQIRFGASPRQEANDTRIGQAYEQLVNGHVLDCKTTPRLGTLCTPGLAGNIVTSEGTGDLSVVAGRWMPDAIISIQRSARDTAIAEVRMKFEPTELYKEFEAAFDSIEYSASALDLADKRQGKTVHATFQRYGDGWHLENVQ